MLTLYVTAEQIHNGQVSLNTQFSILTISKKTNGTTWSDTKASRDNSLCALPL